MLAYLPTEHNSATRTAEITWNLPEEDKQAEPDAVLAIEIGVKPLW